MASTRPGMKAQLDAQSYMGVPTFRATAVPYGT